MKMHQLVPLYKKENNFELEVGACSWEKTP